MAFWDRFNEKADGFDAIEAKLKIDAMRQQYDTILSFLGAEMLTSDTDLDHDEYLAAKGAMSIGKSYFELEKAKIQALGEIIDKLQDLDNRLDDIEVKLMDK